MFHLIMFHYSRYLLVERVQLILQIQANRPNGTVPHQMSEFYAYDHYYVALTSFSTLVSTGFGLCGNTLTQTAWHDGSSTLPTTGDRIYSNSSGTATHNSKYLTTSVSGGVTTSSTGYVNGSFLVVVKKNNDS